MRRAPPPTTWSAGRADRRSTRRMAARGAARSNPATTRGRNDRSTWRYNSERTFESQAMQLFAPSLAFVDLETTGTLAAGDRITEVAVVRVDADPDGTGDPEGRGVEHAGESRRADSARDPGADRHHQRHGARRAAIRSDRRRGRRAHGERGLRRPQCALRLRLPQARLCPARPDASPPGCCARCACRGGSSRRPTATISTA